MSAQRQRILRLFPGDSWRTFGARRFRNQCDYGRSATACLDWLSRPSLKALVWAVRPEGRDALLRVALDMGGGEAYYRLARLPEELTADEAIAAVAGVPIEVVVEAWRSRLVSEDADGGRPLPSPGGPLLWTAAMGLFALTSTRWRG